MGAIQMLDNMSPNFWPHANCMQINKWNKLYETTDWFNTEKGIQQGCILSPCLFNVYAEYIMRNSGLDAGIKTTRRNINNLGYADDTTLMAESEEELKSFLMGVKEESEKVTLKTQH